MKAVGTGALFENQGHRVFMEATGKRYDNMKARIEKKGLPPLTFTKNEFREHFRAALGGREDGAIQCRYCRKFCTVEEVSPDHEIALDQGGSSDLHNIGFPCMQCNQQKGELSPDDYLRLLRFLETSLPMGRVNVLSRLAIAVKNTANMTRQTILIHKLQAELSALRGYAPKKKHKGDGLPPF